MVGLEVFHDGKMRWREIEQDNEILLGFNVSGGVWMGERHYR